MIQDIIDEILAGGDADGEDVKRGEEIFEGLDYPREWAGFVGQETAKAQLQVAVASAVARQAPIEHILIASGVAGVGKSTLATLVAYQSGRGLLRATGPMSSDDFWKATRKMADHDILFIDEAHRLTEGNRTRADWLLPVMTEGKLYTETGTKKLPAITFIFATTDAGKLPKTLLTRCMVTPQITEYSDEDAALIALNLAVRMEVDVPEDFFEPIALAANRNPRVMRKILIQLRDLGYAGRGNDLDLALNWCGLTRDGIDQVGQHFLLVLRVATNYTASIETIAARLGEPGPLRHYEQDLLQRGWIEITGRGRKLTERGVERAFELAQARGVRL